MSVCLSAQCIYEDNLFYFVRSMRDCRLYSSGKNFNTIYCVLKITQEVCFYFELFFAKQDKYDVGMFCKCSPTLKKKKSITPLRKLGNTHNCSSITESLQL